MDGQWGMQRTCPLLLEIAKARMEVRLLVPVVKVRS